ncbi:CobW family GTP-binding protein [Lachnoanaerobaculum saburreum]|uniref:CobW/P47K family protein n=1 Tax=Lachnoanaerobaculum saburreum DSM 3986 TaxID=887325 RepID=E6LP14_9FIRM|nr:CobW family GTP-binding protein [Lachnoanaerobaculum saburreum]EFU76413.1 CobW/P47K family protein [Lachnoanaerobaculum saburreum DSM 3986]
MANTKIDVVSGFLGAGKTTFIKRLVENGKDKGRTIIIENEFGEIGIDGGFLKNSGIEIKEMNSGCICCSLAGDFEASLRELLKDYAPNRVIIEPSGVGKLSDVLKAVSDVEKDLEVESNSAVTVVDVKKCKMYMKNFGEFFNNQIQFANTIILSRTDLADSKKIEEAVALIKEVNPEAIIVTTPLDKLSDEKIEELLSKPIDLKSELLEELAKEHEHHHHHDEHCEHEHHHHHDEHCEHEHHHHHDEHCEHEHHHHDEHCEHEHHHHHDEHCEHDHLHGEHEHHHGHHHADDVFDSWGMEQVPAISEDKLKSILNDFSNEEKYGVILRAKGMVKDADSDDWFYFDLVPGENDIRRGDAEYTGKVCVIGAGLKSEELEKCFRV